MKTLFFNADVYTGEGFAKSFIIEDGKFLKVFDEAQPNIQADEKIDLKGKFVCAGFNDSHMHLLNFGQSLVMARLHEHTDSLAGMMNYVSEFLKENPVRAGQWLRGRGWNQDYFTDVKRMPSKSDLDQISADIPIMLTRACGHCCVVNSKVLEICNIDRNTPSPDGGAVDFENGLLYDNAMDLLDKYIPVPDKEELGKMIIAGAKALNTFGITSCQSDDYCVFGQLTFEDINNVYKQLEDTKQLTVRVNEQSNFTKLNELKRFVESGNKTGTGTKMFRIGPLKMLGDGSLGGRTAHLSKPYYDDPSTCGFSLFSDEQFNEMISYANRHDMQVAVHAIGDACLDKVLNAIENALNECPREDHRHGIVHCQISRQDQLDRMIRLKTHIYAQSVFLDYDNHIVEQRVGKELASTSYNWKTLADNGLTVSNGSDAPVEIPDALKGIECAVTRTSLDKTGPYLPDQAFSVKEALDSFTINSAKASFEENYKGLIKENYLADFVVLDENPFNVDKFRIHEIRVDSTWLNGECVYRNNG
ncbi:MAG: amidohydrolase [Erysipelotrichaceae bacterium]|nr:amidohydrolase [Erysipelotrichaceae bacterium]